MKGELRRVESFLLLCKNNMEYSLTAHFYSRLFCTQQPVHQKSSGGMNTKHTDFIKSTATAVIKRIKVNRKLT